jgi:diguanylate cyclase (GGDEF)-like protein
MKVPAQTVRVLQVEDVKTDAELSLYHLGKAGFECTAQRVETEPDLRAALANFHPDIVLSDFSLPQFNGLAALQIVREVAPEIPFIFLSGTIGEERAVGALHNGAFDYVLKSNLVRLPSAVRRALDDARLRKERRIEQARIARLDRVLRMLSGINALMVRVRDRKDLLNETCRLAVSVGGYAAALIYLKSQPAQALQVQAVSGSDGIRVDLLRDAFLELNQSETGLLEQTVKTNREFVCNSIATLKGHRLLASVLEPAQLRSMVLLPVVRDGTAIGALVLVARDADVMVVEELQMLREVSGNLSFALQYHHKDTTVRFLSYYDSHTGLAKRSLFCERLAKLLEQGASRRSRFAMAIIDIAGLSLINDSAGRRTGDLLLQQVGERLKKHFRDYERLGHFGGGTFAVVVDITGRTREDVIAARREHGAALFGEPYSIEERVVPVGVRSGFAIYPDHGGDAASLVQNAETALATAKASGDREIQYSRERQTQMLDRLAREQRLRLALQHDQFELHYQPKVNVVSRRIEGVEALLRWRDPQNGLVSPGSFLPLLESTGLIVDVGAWVVRRAALDCQHWLSAGLPPIRIAVNISPSQLALADFVEMFLNIQAACTKAGAGGLDIEITEGTLQEELAPEVAKLKMLRSAGVKIAIDDFGTGYSSLSRLAKLPIDTLKIDQSFIREVPDDYAGRMLVKTIVSLARTFRLTTVAEGVEAQEQLDFLWQAGCDQSQGYLHSHPLPRDEFMNLLQFGRGQFVLPPELLSESASQSSQLSR